MNIASNRYKLFAKYITCQETNTASFWSCINRIRFLTLPNFKMTQERALFKTKFHWGSFHGEINIDSQDRHRFISNVKNRNSSDLKQRGIYQLSHRKANLQQQWKIPVWSNLGCYKIFEHLYVFFFKYPCPNLSYNMYWIWVVVYDEPSSSWQLQDLIKWKSKQLGGERLPISWHKSHHTIHTKWPWKKLIDETIILDFLPIPVRWSIDSMGTFWRSYFEGSCHKEC